MGIKDFLKKKTTFNENGFDSEGYNRLGYDRMGYDRNGYDINGYNRDGYNAQGIYKLTGRDKDGFDEFGFNSAGFDRDGFDKDGFNIEGFDKNGLNRYGYDHDGFDNDGYNKEGYNREGYNQKGYDKNGFDKAGFDKYGYDKYGYDKDGFDKKGFNKSGYDSDGFDKKGYDIEGYNRSGFDKNGYDREGYNKAGFNKEGYNRDGYDKKGFNRDGYDREGFNKKGFDKDGFNREGFDKNGYDREGFDKDGFNSNGIDREGFNNEGFNSEGYDRDGYNKKGFNKSGLTRYGFKEDEFDSEGYHKITKLDVWGYSRYGYNVIGINKHTGRDRLGFDANGIDENGFNIWGFNNETQVDIRGNDIESYEDDPQMTEEMCSSFETLYYQYMAGKTDVSIELANCYVNGRGTVRDYKKAIRILLDVAIEYHNLEAIRELADHFYIGDIVGENKALSAYFNDIFDNKRLEAINQYKERKALEFQQPVNSTDKTFKEEQKHLEKVIHSLDEQIERESESLFEIDDDTSWMDFDQKLDWRIKKQQNIEVEKNIEEFNTIKQRPYYARMDALTNKGRQSFYIGEYAYVDGFNPSCNILSVWSDVGKRYRDSSRVEFSTRGNKYEVTLRRKIDIARGQLVGFYDEYVEGSEAAKADITNPYLLKVLEEKRGEKNITNIIRSIQMNQNDIIEADFNSNIIVQGCAGSGKTMILLHRLANMKYNRPNYDWSRVKIITPNKDFALFIDELSRNLRINEIEKLTLQEYYMQILQKYDRQYPEQNEKGNSIYHFYEGNERKKLRDESEIKKDILDKIYSDKFKKEIQKLVSDFKEDISCYMDAMDILSTYLDDILEKFDCKLPKRLPNYTFVLYLKTMVAYYSFGALRNNESMLCIDEGQDICEQQYVLLYKVNGQKTCLNIYGDLEQRISQNVSVSSWDSLKKMLGASYYVLNENYRNSENIIRFYGKTLGINNGSFGLKTKDVEQFEESELDILLKMQLLLGNRTVVISNSEDCVPPSVLSLCREGKISENTISIMNVKQVKGLEFDTAFVFDEDMDKNEKYISYTRALSELYVSSDIPGNKVKALDIKNEDEEENQPDYPELRFDEEVIFYDQTPLYEDGDIYITLGIPTLEDNCYSVKMALGIDMDSVSDIRITVNDFAMYNMETPLEQDLKIEAIPVFIPKGDTEEEQIISFSIPIDRIPDYLLRDIENKSDDFEFCFSLSISYEDTYGEKIEDYTEVFDVDVNGNFVEDDNEVPEPENKYVSITELDDVNERSVLIVVREGWSNDFCFVVERFDGQMARGSQYLNGNFYKKSSYNRYSQEFTFYNGPSLNKIEDQYE